MTHYQKLVTAAFRIIGVFFLVAAALTFPVALFFSLFGIFAHQRGGLEIALPLFIFYTLPTVIIGLVFFKLSRKLAKKVCFDFDEQ